MLSSSSASTPTMLMDVGDIDPSGLVCASSCLSDHPMFLRTKIGPAALLPSTRFSYAHSTSSFALLTESEKPSYFWYSSIDCRLEKPKKSARPVHVTGSSVSLQW